MTHVTLVIGAGFPLLSLSLVTEPLRLANREHGSQLFQWRVVSPDGAGPSSSSGQVLAVDGPLDDEKTDVVLLLASYGPERMRSRALMAWLRRRARSGCIMGGVDTGALLFAEAGLLTKRPAAAHPEALAALQETAGVDAICDRLFDVEGDRCSSAGSIVTLDMTLSLIERFSSARLAKRVAEILLYSPVAPETPNRGRTVDWTTSRMDRRLLATIDVMRRHLEPPLSLSEVAEQVQTPPWNLRRLFQKQFSQSPQTYYRDLRLDHARNLLRNSTQSVGTIAMICGFSAPESFSRAYRERYGRAPSNDRSLS